MSIEKDIDLVKYDTLGKRLRYFREEEIGESREKFIQGLDITARTLERYEDDESSPSASFFTKLNAKYQETINLDWLLSGRGILYVAPPIKPESTKESETPYYDIILERMHEQLNRIYEEKDFSKLAALQSLLSLIDPEAKKDK